MINTPEQIVPTVSPEELAERGYRYVERELEDGTTKYELIPLTEQEYLHPEEGYHMPTSVFHTMMINALYDLLTRWYAENPSVGVFSDLQLVWDMPGLEPHSPDVCVIFGIKDKEMNRRRFEVAVEGVRPRLIIEVVSPRYRTADRIIKVEEYERAGVQEYVIIDRRRERGELAIQLLGYQLSDGRYREIISDDQGRILLETVGLWMGVNQDQVVLENAASGERLLTAHELEARLREEQAAREAAERQIAALNARLQELEAERAKNA